MNRAGCWMVAPNRSVAIKTQGGWRPYRAVVDTDDEERRLGASAGLYLFAAQANARMQTPSSCIRRHMAPRSVLLTLSINCSTTI